MRTSSLPSPTLGAREPIAINGFEFSGGAGVPAELVDAARNQARAVGYAQGWAEGQREHAASQAAEVAAARAERSANLKAQADQVATAVLAVLRAADGLGRVSIELTDQLADSMLTAAVELAAALLGQELTDPVASARGILARVMNAAPLDESVAVRLSPSDYQTLTGPDGAALLAALDPTATARLSFESDPTLAPGDAVARAGATTVDARLSAAVQRLREFAG